MKLVGAILIIAGLVFGTAIIEIAAHQPHVSYFGDFVLCTGALTAAAEIAVGLLIMVKKPRYTR